MNREPANPFTPGFGVSPRHLVGRDEMKDDLSNGLDRGPSDKRFSAVLLGSRGSGKTVMLNAMQEVTAGSGWVNLAVDATTGGLPERILTQIEHAADTHENLPGPAADTTETVKRRGLGGRIGWFSSEDLRRFKPRWDLRRHLTALGRLAAERGSGVLITLDEMHAADITELRRFAADMQHIAQREQLPVAVLAAGLLDMQRTLFVDPKLSFFVRSHHAVLPHITAAQAFGFFRDSINENGGRADADALRIMADAAGPYPIKLQAIGDAVWDCAGAPHGLIDATAAHEALRQAEEFLAGRLYPQVWHDLGLSERRFLAALADHGGAVRQAEFLAEMQTAVVNPGEIWERLAANECVTADPYGIAGFGPAMSLAAAARGARTLPPVGAREAVAAAAGAVSGGSAGNRSNEFMPRARRRCVLARGHAGPCRSRR